ncbi:Predicted acetyltransferase [Jatrophihabitans endophyticus]|uniref:Predicted acetyltransferase n=1 Tax=Jatrophihabitans endophyticus TaxID=1206085 RepID=A0A1M5G6N5_9ACTN|nr:GNAT family N-acetyltransferase [Jatrophihabitans endophyticus]SHF99383.1 Predicted acetyltransferase [Jatrophihabitans endophyticus]
MTHDGGPRLVAPTATLHDAWRAAHEEWGPGLHEDGFGLGADDDVSDRAGFATWLAALERDPGQLWWILDGAAVAGGIALRADDHPMAGRHGHVGYGIRPSFRGRGLATWALGQVLAEARSQRRESVRVVCARDNVASARVAEHHGGRLEAPDDGRVRRYVIDLAGR